MTRRWRPLVIGVAAAALFPMGCEWHLETLDGTGSTRPGHTNNNVGYQSAPIIYNGNPHVFYKDSDNKALRHAYWNGFAWVFENLDGAGSVLPGHSEADTGWQPSVILCNGRPHVFYHDDDADSLRHAYWNGVSWAFETLDGDGGPNGRTTSDAGSFSASMLYNNRPHVFYRESDNRLLRHAYYNGSAWAFETLDGERRSQRTHEQPGRTRCVGGPLQRGATRLLRRSDRRRSPPRLLQRLGLGFPKRSTGTAGCWTHDQRCRTVLDGGPVRRPTARLLYWNQTANSLRHSYYNGSAWGFETLDGAAAPDRDTPRPTSVSGLRRSSTAASLRSSTRTPTWACSVGPIGTAHRGSSRSWTAP
ncbi:MAG: hypothetical protein M5U31_16430 [Acidimicrobiia bacterium]|nr:hypothetical protein [Acidimicrobiia bacterium]